MIGTCESCGNNGQTHCMLTEDEHTPTRSLCAKCFSEQLEQHVRLGIAWWGELGAAPRIMVGASGIDSVGLVLCLLALGYGDSVVCCIVREGNLTHRDEEIRIWSEISQQWGIRLVKRDFSLEYGKNLNEIVDARSETFVNAFTPCLACALLRNRLLYLTAIEEGCSVLAVGGHADDAACNQLGAYLFGRTVTLGGISYKRYFPPRQQIGHLTLLRPLVLEPKANIEEYVRAKARLSMPSYTCRYLAFRGTFKMQKVIDLLSDAFPGARRILASQAIREAPRSVAVCGVCGAFRDELEVGQCAACSLMKHLEIT